MIMNDTLSTHRSRVPQRSSGRINGGVTTVEDERTRPGLYFVICVWQSSVRGCRFTFVFILLLKCLNVRRFPPLSSPIYELCYKRDTFQICSKLWFGLVQWSFSILVADAHLSPIIYQILERI